MILAWVVNPAHEKSQIEKLLDGIFETFEKDGCWYLTNPRSLGRSLIDEKAWFSRRIDAVNGFIRVSSVPMNLIEVAGWYYKTDDEEIRAILEAPTNLVVKDIEDNITPNHISFVRGLMKNEHALEAYSYMRRHGDWYGLYKAHEVIKKNFGKELWGNVVAKKEWARLGQTANSYRHSKYGADRVDSPMSYHDAQHIIKNVLDDLVKSQ